MPLLAATECMCVCVSVSVCVESNRGRKVQNNVYQKVARGREEVDGEAAGLQEGLGLQTAPPPHDIG